jgi:beta-lactamase class A
MSAQSKTDALLEDILRNAKNPSLDTIINHAQKFRCQIIYTQINRDKNNHPVFHHYYFNYDPAVYFYPASTVKLPLALLALEKLNTLKPKIDKHTTIQFDSSYAGQTILHSDSTAANGLPSIAHLIKRAFLISENDPYNRFYQFVGQRGINRKLHEKGYKNALITRQFMGFTEEQNRHTNAVRFLKKDGSLLYHQPPAYNTDSFNFSITVKLGRAYMDRNDSLVQGPFDFSRYNKFPLEDLQQVLQSVMFPETVSKKQRFHLSDDDYDFVRRMLSQYPSETPYPKYDTSVFYDSYVKFFFAGKDHQMPKNIRVFNKVGWAYGFMTDVSYVADFENKLEFMLSATVYVNSDEVVNDNQYDYDTLGKPFMYALGQTIYNYELQRNRQNMPDLSKFLIEYEHRDASDKRPPVNVVDN